MTHQPQSSALNMQAECSVSTNKDRVAIILKQDPGSQLHAVLRREAGKSAQYSDWEPQGNDSQPLLPFLVNWVWMKNALSYFCDSVN